MSELAASSGSCGGAGLVAGHAAPPACMPDLPWQAHEQEKAAAPPRNLPGRLSNLIAYTAPFPPCRAKWKGKGKKKKKKRSAEDDLYGLLGLQHEVNRGWAGNRVGDDRWYHLLCPAAARPPAHVMVSGPASSTLPPGGQPTGASILQIIHVSCSPAHLPLQRWTATDAQIKAAYRRSALLHHPDKQVGGSGRSSE